MKRILLLLLTAFALACAGPDAQDTDELGQLSSELAAGSVTSSPSTVRINLNEAYTGTTTICWNTSGTSTAEIWLSMNGLPETLFARGQSGCQDATWIVSDNTYEFRLYAEMTHTTMLGFTTVVGEGYYGPTEPVCPPSCRSGFHCCPGESVCKRITFPCD
ncbi:hypothetical protein [Myxococcus qinghaiensis]|uniref:hypothetical protein n=1 Tax=Myxococcus qinghaiensis TaxID=2906758 RepID=UPI0020A7E602|nr:hypothetical protein [Myxococcus qinghaiensis]MCP3162137.1 hypothetical protein [Myxococcus qinghaiensis]